MKTLVTGSYRSGTSLVSAILDDLGCDFGDKKMTYPPADRSNPLGYFQHKEIIALNSRIIHKYCPDSSGLNPVWDYDDLCWLSDFKESIALANKLDAIKDPRFSVTLPFWLDNNLLPVKDMRVIIVRRNTKDIAKSIVNHHAVAQYCNNDLGLAQELAAYYIQSAISVVKYYDLPHFFVDYETLVQDPKRVISDIGSFVGCTDSSSIFRAKLNVGKRRAKFIHYLRKLTTPRKLVVDVYNRLKE